MSGTDVLLAREEGVATITLNRPDKMNAMIPAVSEGLYNAFSEAAKDESVRVIVITGSGTAFCAGADVSALAKQATDTQAQASAPPRPARVHLALLIQSCDKPVIASLNGVAVGFGLDLALACDIRIASEEARLCEAYIRRGMLPSGGGTYFLPRLIGLDKALLVAWTGDMIDAREAEKLGLVTLVVPHSHLADATRDLAERLAKAPFLAVQKTKRAIYDGLTMELKTHLEYTAEVRRGLLKTEDHKEGTTSFVEKRAPRFKGQ